MWFAVSCHIAAHHFPTMASSWLILVQVVTTQEMFGWASTVAQTPLQVELLGLS